MDTNNANQTTVTEESTRDALIRKLTSRKFIMSLVGLIIGVLGMINHDDNVIKLVAFAVVSAVSIVAYITVEGRIDAAAVTDIADTITEIIEDLQESGIMPLSEDKIEPCAGYLATTDVTMDPISRAIYDCEPGTTTTVSITKSPIEGLELDEVTNNKDEDRA